MSDPTPPKNEIEVYEVLSKKGPGHRHRVAVRGPRGRVIIAMGPTRREALVQALLEIGSFKEELAKEYEALNGQG
jgi:hypothetical protein